MLIIYYKLYPIFEKIQIAIDFILKFDYTVGFCICSVLIRLILTKRNYTLKLKIF